MKLSSVTGVPDFCFDTIIFINPCLVKSFFISLCENCIHTIFM